MTAKNATPRGSAAEARVQPEERGLSFIIETGRRELDSILPS